MRTLLQLIDLRDDDELHCNWGQIMSLLCFPCDVNFEGPADELFALSLLCLQLRSTGVVSQEGAFFWCLRTSWSVGGEDASTGFETRRQ